MKFLIPLVVALLGLGAGVGAGLALKPAPKPESAEYSEDCDPLGEMACEEQAKSDPFKAIPKKAAYAKEDLVYVPLRKPFIVPIFEDEKVVAMVVLTLTVEAVAGPDMEKKIEGVEPRLRDGLLNAMFLHANSDGFSGSFTTGQKMEDLKAALLSAVQEVVGSDKVNGVLITEIARQDV